MFRQGVLGMDDFGRVFAEVEDRSKAWPNGDWEFWVDLDLLPEAKRKLDFIIGSGC